MKAIGGYFELENPCQSSEWHQHALRLNSGRNALEYIIRTGSFSNIFLPDYCCDVLAAKAEQCRLPVVKYEVNSQMEVAGMTKTPGPESLFVVVNYFGLKSDYIAGLNNTFPHLVVDNVQAFFADHFDGTASFNSARKFFGVPDGAYLYPFNNKEIPDLETDDSSARTGHLIDRMEKSPEAGYEKYRMNEKTIDGLPLRKMSLLTQKMLESVNYETAVKKRRENYQFLHERIGEKNQFVHDLPDHAVPMAYPFLSMHEGLREQMIRDRIFVPVLWPELLKDASRQSYAFKFAKHLLPLPIDHRLDFHDMERIIKHIP